MSSVKTIIDRETTQRIIDTADIVEVVSDFVNLHRRGSNYIGLCPFHNERTPSFSVSRAKGICKCFSCGKGGSAVNFIMEHEQLSYWEALRYLAKKYHIEIQEHEITDQERREMGERLALLEVNDFAMQHFAHNMLETPDGQAVGMAYFRERGINEAMVKRFQLGYSLDKSTDLSDAAIAKGYNPEALIKTGLCVRDGHGELRDRFKARVMYPVFSIAGKVVAFGGRTLRSDKSVAKYVNSPESAIYKKSRELYGLYQAKREIVRKDKCILVEGYMDVISMHQQGIENVVASSGTSLTPGQIRLIHRFTENVTVIYDSDAAGIKASLRGIDLLLAEGLDIKVLLLPDGDDPDSFAQSHTAQEVETYLAEHEVDFIRFKTDVLMRDASNDPLKRSEVLGSILQSIANIPQEIKRAEYIKECAMRFGVDERMLTRQVTVFITKVAEQNARLAKQAAAEESVDKEPFQPSADELANNTAKDTPQQENLQIDQSLTQAVNHASTDAFARMLEPQERSLLRLVLKYGMMDLGEDFGEYDNGSRVKVIDYIREDLDVDNVKFHNTLYNEVYAEALRIRDNQFDDDLTRHIAQLNSRIDQLRLSGLEEIKNSAANLEQIHIAESKLNEACSETYVSDLREYLQQYLERIFLSYPDDTIRRMVSDLVVDKHQLSKIYFRQGVKIETETDRLDDLVPRALVSLKYYMGRCHFQELTNRIKQIQSTPGYSLDEILALMQKQKQWHDFCTTLATQIGERVYDPLR